jgi:anaerobic magnesium-protoporphyrin IX monomethyl ester cyclase
MRILLVNPPSGLKVYAKSKIVTAITNAPYITLAVLAASARAAGAKVAVLDLVLSNSPSEDLLTELKRFKPDMVGTTFTSQLYYEGQAIAAIAKKHNPKVITICGGVHTSYAPEETLAEGDFDLACIGEGDQTLAELAAGKNPTEVDGLVVKQNGGFFHTPPRKIIENMDDLPFPAYDLYPIHRYKSTRLTSKRDPVGYVETSRGCPYRCTYCSHVVGFGHKVRAKSAERVFEEFKYMRSLGFNDMHIKDENFTTNLNRAKTICELLLKNNWDRPWSLPTGIRTKDLDRDFAQLARRSGCFGMAFGVESGDENVLAGVNKKQNLDQMARAIEICTKAGIETRGFFMLGLPDDTVETMERTINYACSLNMTFGKASVFVPLPGSVLFEQYKEQGLITSYDWSKYNFHTAPEVYRHKTLKWSTIRQYYDKFYRRYYLRPRFIARRLIGGIATGVIVRDFRYFAKTDWS